MDCSPLRQAGLALLRFVGTEPTVVSIDDGIYVEFRKGDDVLYFEMESDSTLFAYRKAGHLVSREEIIGDPKQVIWNFVHLLLTIPQPQE
jgi:hypothetical protein